MEIKDLRNILDKVEDRDQEQDIIIKYMVPHISPSFLTALVNDMIDKEMNFKVKDNNRLFFHW